MSNSFPFKTLVTIIFLLASCTERHRIIPLNIRDAGTMSDAFYTQRPLPDTGPPCNPADISNARLSTDYNNCGICGRFCHAEYSDHCANGSCMCGNERACPTGSGCRNGQCLVQNPMGNSCEFDGSCFAGFVCIEGRCTRLDCVAEICDDIDNDCDGEIDENNDATGPLSQWCFTGTVDPASLMRPCHRGTRVCEIGGYWSSCSGSIEPINEAGLLACNNADDNCDGCVDGTINMAGVCEHATISGFDIIYVIDISGSMADTIDAVKIATLNFSTRFAFDPTFRFGIVATPGYYSLTSPGSPPPYDATAYTILDLSPYSVFISRLMTMAADGGGSEATWDSIYEMGTGENSLSWRTDSARLMILFTDENAQSYRMYRSLINVDESSVCASLTHGESLIVFTDTRFFSQWDDCATTLELSTDPVTMYDGLNTILTDPCSI